MVDICINNTWWIFVQYSYADLRLLFVGESSAHAQFLLHSDIIRLCRSHPVVCALSSIHIGVFSKEFFMTPVLYLCFAIRV